MELYETKEYEQFSFLDENRPINKKNVEAKIESIHQLGNLMNYYPIFVTPEFQILDGQHRFEAAKLTNSTIWYTIIFEQTEQEKIIKLNGYQVPWKMKEFINFYGQKNNEDYIRFNKFCDRNRMSYSIAANLLYNRKDKRSINENIKQGTFEFSTEQEKTFSEFIDYIVKVKDFIHLKQPENTYINGRSFSRGMQICYHHKGWLTQRFIDQITNYLDLLKKSVDISESVNNLFFIYNYRRSHRLSLDPTELLTVKTRRKIL